MSYYLSDYAKEAGYRLEHYDIVSSTNDLAAEFAKSGDNGHLWLIADQQTKGRGRRGRSWQSPQGSMSTSLLLVEDFEIKQVAQLGFVAGLALIEALHEMLPTKCQIEPGIFLKWPNDILAGSAKLAGILPEILSLPKHKKTLLQKQAVIIGIGVNIQQITPLDTQNSTNLPNDKQRGLNKSTKSLHNSDNKPNYPIISLQQLAPNCQAKDIFAALSKYWVENYNLWNYGQGMAALKDKWLKYAAYIGKTIHLKQGDLLISGIFETIDDEGRLVLLQEDGTRQYIAAGDVFFGEVASASAV